MLWSEGPRTVREVHEAIGRSKAVAYTTTLKQMQVMHQKGLLGRTERFRSHVYRRDPRPAGEGPAMTGGLASPELPPTLGWALLRSLWQTASPGAWRAKRIIELGC